MSVASASRTVKWISKGGTYSAMISSPCGDLYQMWEGTQAQVTKIYPDFTDSASAYYHPILYFVAASSRTAENPVTPDSIDFYIGSTKLTWSGDTSTNSFGGHTGHFKKIAPSGAQLYYGLQIMKNLVEDFSFAPITVRMVAHISSGIQSDELEASYPIPISVSTGSTYRVTIAAGDTNNFVITAKGGSCILRAKVFQGGTEITYNLSYVWEKLTSNGWTTLSTTTQNLTVNEADIDTFGTFRVTVSQGGTELGKDIQGVMDTSDPYEIDANPCKSTSDSTYWDETIEEDNVNRASGCYMPRLLARGSDTAITTGLQGFTFIVRDAAGVFLNTVTERTTPGASCTVTSTQCAQAGGDLAVDIFAHMS